MEKELYLTSLYDYYKELLTDKQQTYFELYYFEDLTMEEIADNLSVSKNAVSKTLKEIKEKLDYYEAKLNLLNNKEKIEKILAEEEFNKISSYI